LASNQFYKYGADPLHTWSASFYSVVQNADPYAIPAGNLTALNAANTNLASAITSAQNAENAFHAAIAAKNAAMASVLDAIKPIAKLVYANALLTEAEIAATGLAIHDTQPTPVTVGPISNPVVNAFADATAVLTWDRNGNPQGVIFEVESSTNGTDWSFWGSTTRRKAELSGVTPGVTRWFRIRAAKSGQASAWSVPVAAYGPEEGMGLQLAA
jgi:hypothetical protein